MNILKQVGVSVTELPSTFTPHKQIKKVYELRRAMIESGEGQALDHTLLAAPSTSIWL